MRRTIMELILVVWIAFLGVSRISLLGDSGGFLLTPFLVLSPIVIGLGAATMMASRRPIGIPRRLKPFVLILWGMLAVILVSAFFSADLETSARRTLLLYLQIAFVVAIGVLLANRPDPRNLLVRGAMLGLAVSVAANILQVTFWFWGDWLPGSMSSFVLIQPGNYEGVIPRLTGGSHDPNHGGILILIYLFVIVTLGGPSRFRTWLVWAGVLSILLTLSRSVILSGLIMVAASMLRRSRLRLSRRLILGSIGSVWAVAVVLLLMPATFEYVEAAWSVLGGRFTLGEGSTRQHAAVLARGIEVATYDLKHMLLGVGYGNAYLTLQDIFPGNRYGNFHSLFVTLFAESGIVAAALGALLFVQPLMRGGVYQPAIVGLLAFNLFQQSQTEPVSWFLLLLAWTGIGAAAGAQQHSRSRSDTPGQLLDGYGAPGVSVVANRGG